MPYDKKNTDLSAVSAIILAGGRGTRISEYTKIIPKPMIKINGKPIITYIINHYAKFGVKNFYITLGYKGFVIKNYFKKYKNKFNQLKINLIETGNSTMTGGRLLRLKNIIKESNFFLTYGDGVSNVDLKKLFKLHKSKNKIATLTAVRPPARFGSIKLSGSNVKYFKEKSNLDEGWINGGFFVLNKKIFKYLKNDKTYLEREPFEQLVKTKNLVAFKHNDFWQCMDTIRDKEILEEKTKKYKF